MNSKSVSTILPRIFIYLFFIILPLFLFSNLEAGNVTLSTSKIEISFVDSTHYGIDYIKNSDGDSIAFDYEIPLWSITLFDISMLDTAKSSRDLYDIMCNDASSNCDSVTHGFQYPQSGDTILVINWTGVTHDDFPENRFNVKAKISILSGAEDVSFTIAVKNDSNFVSLFNVDYPYYWIQEDETDSDQILAIPHRSHGNLIKDPITRFEEYVNDQLNQNESTKRDAGFGGEAPEGNCGFHPGLLSNQFFAYYDKGGSTSTGLYAATTDTLGYLKAFHIRGDTTETTLECFTRHFPEDNDANFETTYTMPYLYKMRPFRGDWIDASKIYRDWLVDSPIIKDVGGSLQFRKDFQAVVDSADYAFNLVPDDTTMEEQLDYFYSDSSDSLIALGRFNAWGSITPYLYIYDYICNWREETQDSVYPPDYVDAFKNMNGKIGAYTNLRLVTWHDWDDYIYMQDDTTYVCGFPDTASCEDDSNAVRVNSAILNINGDTLRYGSDECFVEHCSAETLWQDKYINGVGYTLEDADTMLGANFIYSDTRGTPILCYGGDDHGHPNGGGSYYLQG